MAPGRATGRKQSLAVRLGTPTGVATIGCGAFALAACARGALSMSVSRRGITKLDDSVDDSARLEELGTPRRSGAIFMHLPQ